MPAGLEVNGGAVEIGVWDTDPTLPTACPADPCRVGQHGLEIAMAVCRSLEGRREPVGKRLKAAIVLADYPGSPAYSRRRTTRPTSPGSCCLAAAPVVSAAQPLTVLATRVDDTDHSGRR